MKKQMKNYYCQIVKLTILGLLIFSLSGCQQSCQQSDEVAEKRPRVKNTPEVEQANVSNTQSPTSPVSNTQNPTPPVSTATATPQPKAKPVDCDKKCYKVYDQCSADYRQSPDVETICKGKQSTCLSGCSSSTPQSTSQSTKPPDNCVVKGANDTPLRVRSNPGGNVIGSLNVGSQILAYDLVQDSSGENWTKIKYKGGFGYVSTQFISCG